MVQPKDDGLLSAHSSKASIFDNMTAAKTAMLAVSKKMVEEVDNTRRLMQINLEFFEEIWMLSLVKIVLIMSDIVCVLPFATQIYSAFTVLLINKSGRSHWQEDGLENLQVHVARLYFWNNCSFSIYAAYGTYIQH